MGRNHQADLDLGLVAAPPFKPLPLQNSQAFGLEFETTRSRGPQRFRNITMKSGF
jgi:hypothetical protein